jgi:hypothetical protein
LSTWLHDYTQDLQAPEIMGAVSKSAQRAGDVLHGFAPAHHAPAHELTTTKKRQPFD